MKRAVILMAAAVLGGALPVLGQWSYTGTTLTENFNGMGTNGTVPPTNWYVGPATNGQGPISKRTLRAGNGSTSTVTNWNVGVNSNTDRALGSQAGTAAGGDLNMEVRIRNDTGLSLGAITVTYDGEQWRVNNNVNVQTLVMLYSANGSNFTSMGSVFTFSSPNTNGNTNINGNQATNRQAGLGGAYTLPAPVPPTAVLYLRWLDENDANNDHLLAIDNFSFSATVTNDPMSVAIASPTNGQQFHFSVDVPVTAVTGGSVSNVAFYVDGQYVATDTNLPFMGAIPMAFLSEGSHVLGVVATNALGEATNSANVTIVITSNQPPAIAITNAVSGTVTGATFLVGSVITVQPATTDEAPVTNVAWYVNGQFYMNEPAAPFSFDLIDPLAGAYTVQGVATDRGGLQATSSVYTLMITNPASLYTLLITNGASWRYYANTSAPPMDGDGLAWPQIGYDDTGWPVGRGELGGGDGAVYPETTVIDLGPDTNRYSTIYFRHDFFLTNRPAYASLVLHLLRDDGAVVYLNEHAIWTNNIPAATNGLSYATMAAGASDDGTVYQLQTNSSAYLLRGLNTVAVEVHQSSLTSTDLSFDFMLWAENVVAPTVAITAPANGQTFVGSTNVTVAATASSYVTNVVFFLDGTNLAGADATPPFSVVLSNISSGIRRLEAVAYDQYGQSVTSAPITITVTPNQPPLVAITNVFNGTNTSGVFAVGTVITNYLRVSDDVGVTNVDFLMDNALFLRLTAAPFTVIVNDALAGLHTFHAVATDNAGLSTVSLPVTVTVTNPPYVLLVTNGSHWKYLATTNLNFSNEWQQLAFDDAGWSNGWAELGNGDAQDFYPETTLIDLGPSTNRFRTIYFRHTFEVANPAAFDLLVLSVLRDDAAAIYLNGNQVFATGFTNGTVFPVTYNTLGSNSAVDDGTLYHRTNVNPALLVAGTNIVAVEVHQNSITSSDLSFDLMLWAQRGVVTGPRLFIANEGAALVIRWPDAGLVLQQNNNLATTNWTAVPGDPQFLYLLPLPVTGNWFFRLASP